MTSPRLLVLALLAAPAVAPAVAPAIAEEADLTLFDRIELQAHARLQAVRGGDAELAPFTTDGCSGGMSATWEMVATLAPDFADIHLDTPPWQACCVTHDRAYHLGGEDSDPLASFAARKTADEVLRHCVAETVEDRREVLVTQYGLTETQIETVYELIAGSMYDAVRVGGGPCSGLPWRWGYGWPQCGVLSGLSD